MDFKRIDLTRVEQATPLLINNEQQEYQSRTLLDKNNGRYAYLPIFPTQYVGPNECLLLGNVPGSYVRYKLIINHFISLSFS